MEKKTTVPPSAVARTAPCSAPGTSTQTTVTSAGVPDRGRDGERVGGVGDDHAVGEPGGAQRGRLGVVAHQAGELGGPRGARCGQAEAAGLAGGAQDGDRARPGPLDHPGGRGRCPADVEHGQRDGVGQVVGQDGGDRAGEQDRRPLGRDLLRPAVPAGQPVGDPQRGEGEGDQRGHPVARRTQPQRRLRPDGVHDADEHAAGAGDRVLHLAAGARRSPGRRPARPRRRRRAASDSWRNDAASRLSRSTAMRTSSGPIAGSASSRRAAWGSTPAGSRTRCTPEGPLRRSSHATLPSHPFGCRRTYRVDPV